MKIISDDEIRQAWANAVRHTDTRRHGSGGAAIRLARWVEAKLLGGQVRQTANNREHTISCSSGFGAKTEKPFVVIEMDGELLAQIPPESARSLAYGLLVSAEAAEQDAFLATFVQKELGGTVEMAGGILNAYRKWREGSTDDFTAQGTKE